MERRCNVLTVVSVMYCLYVCATMETFISLTGFTFEILALQCLFVLLFGHSGFGLIVQSKYRPSTTPSLMCLMMVPLCLVMDTLTKEPTAPTGLYGFDDVLLSLGTTAVIITKYFFLLDKNKLTVLAVLTATMGYVLIFCNISTAVMSIFASLLLWKLVKWIPNLTPRSFSMAELGICLQLGVCFFSRIVRELSKMQPVYQDELRLKWIGATAVIAIVLATLVIWMLKAFLRTVSLQVFLGVYAVFAVTSLSFLTWVIQDNLIIWFLQLVQGDCTLKMLLLSWLLFCGVTVTWTVSHSLQASTSIQRHEHISDNSKCPVGRQGKGEEAHEDLSRQRNLNTPTLLDGDADVKQHHRRTLSKSSRVSFNKRKMFHVFILLVYIPGLLVAPHVLLMASCLAFGVFIIVEAARVLRVPWLGTGLNSILATFIDERDQGVVFLTHFYLLVGLSLPLWLTQSPLTEASPIKLYSGVLSLGIGDTVACVAGRAFGRHRWRGTEKTMEGTLCSIGAQLCFVYTCFYYDLLPSLNHAGVWLGVTHNALYEAFTDQIDNLVLPFALFPFLCST